ncbi:MAG: RidA family protein [Pseudomonadota bacterium]
MRTLLPEGWPRPSGYANGIEAIGRTIFVAGQIGWDTEGRFPETFVGQLDQTLANTIAVLEAGDAGPENIVRMTWYLTDLDAYRNALADVSAIWKRRIGRVYPAMAVIGVSGLVEREAMIEIETTAVVAD